MNTIGHCLHVLSLTARVVALVALSSIACSRRADSTNAAMASMAELTTACGQKEDGQIHIPPDYERYTPPPRGGSYTDPKFGCSIMRLTDSREQFNLAVHHQYSTISAMNQDDTLVMLITEWGEGLIVNLTGEVVVAPHNFPKTNSGNWPWDRKSANAFFYTNGRTLYKGAVVANKVDSTPLHAFDEYPNVVVPDEEDLSEDGDHLWLVGGTKAFLYTISTGVSGPAISVGAKDAGCSWHKVQITPSNKMLVTWNCDGPETGQGQEIYNPDGTRYWHMFNSSVHTDIGRDLNGREVAVVSRVPDTHQEACPHRGGVDTILVAPPHTTACLIDAKWADTHVSYRSGSSGWVVASFFSQGECPGHSCFGPRLSSNWQSLWRQFSEELVLARIDGAAVVRLAHHRSRSAEYYWAQSRATISRDAHYVVFDSNMGLSNTGLTDYSDVYLIKVR